MLTKYEATTPNVGRPRRVLRIPSMGTAGTLVHELRSDCCESKVVFFRKASSRSSILTAAYTIEGTTLGMSLASVRGPPFRGDQC
jgi:hypothetical protein